MTTGIYPSSAISTHFSQPAIPVGVNIIEPDPKSAKSCTNIEITSPTSLPDDMKIVKAFHNEVTTKNKRAGVTNREFTSIGISTNLSQISQHNGVTTGTTSPDGTKVGFKYLADTKTVSSSHNDFTNRDLASPAPLPADMKIATPAGIDQNSNITHLGVTNRDFTPTANNNTVLALSTPSHTIDSNQLSGAPAVTSLPSSTKANSSYDTNAHDNNSITESSWSTQDYIQANKIIRESGLCNARGCRIPIPTAINHNFLATFVNEYHDKEVLDFAKFGWPLSTNSDPIQSYIPSNHASARENPKEIQKFLKKAERLNSILGPFEYSPFNPPICFSPLGAVDKKDSSSKRIIHDMSWPRDGSAVNDHIDKNSFLGDTINLHYPGVDNLVEIIKRKGVGCAIFKRDIASAYRQILRVDPGCIHQLAFSWNHKVYHDLTKPQGCRSAALSCQRFTEFIIFIYQQLKGQSDGVVYQDDMADAEIWSNAFQAYDLMGTVLINAGIQEAVEKRTPPCTKMVFLGVLFDTLNMTISVTPERLDDIRTQLLSWKNKITCTKKEIQSLIVGGGRKM